MAKKNYVFKLSVPLCLIDFSSIRSVKDGFKSISFNVDFEKGFCSIFARSKCDRFIIETVDDYFFSLLNDDDLFDFIYSSIHKEYLKDLIKENLRNGLQKKNEKELVLEKFPKRSWSEKS